MLVWWGQEERASREQKPRDGVGGEVTKTTSAGRLCHGRKGDAGMKLGKYIIALGLVLGRT